MCGITGYWSHDAAPLAEARFRAFTVALAHRGPDGQGIQHFPGERLFLGHRRLSIIDISDRGVQPMSYGDGRYWLTYNGEVYNYLELREELRGLGHSFRSETDSEVILAAYAQWGPACQLRFNGMWAFAIWDTRDRTLIAGDAYTTVGGVHTGAKGSWNFPFAAMATWHKPTAIDAARALRALEPSRLAVGHGRVVEAPGPQMDAAIAGVS